MSSRPAKPRVWQRMLSGRRLDLADPSPFDIEISDIAHGLARVARWNGQTEGAHAFSVAQHSVLVEQIATMAKPSLTRAERLAALLHDAPEYVVGDMISPFKALVGGEYKIVEARLQAAIHLRFGLPADRPAALTDSIKAADRVAAFFEATGLAGFTDAEAAKFFGRPRGIRREQLALEPWTTAEAEQAFLRRFEALHDTAAAGSISA
ncbi:HD family hydrolase [Kaistia adipata]|uniref:HD family hydrolase n=1 Tax=Kaistia adipata TaxID=166954 RepID=UPI000427CB9A|nr:HD family hydrolase [Kaistia adipata]